MTDLSAAVDSYLATRRGLEFKLVDAGTLFPDFVTYLHQKAPGMSAPNWPPPGQPRP